MIGENDLSYEIKYILHLSKDHFSWEKISDRKFTSERRKRRKKYH